MWMYNDELYHYGVLGMKWGMRKARKQGTSYNYKSWGQKRWEKKAAKVNSHIQKKGMTSKLANKQYRANKKVQVLKQRDKNRETYVRSTTVKADIARNILMTPIGNGMYNRKRASGRTILQSLYSADFGKGAEMATARSQVDSSAPDSTQYYKRYKKKRSR